MFSRWNITSFTNLSLTFETVIILPSNVLEMNQKVLLTYSLSKTIKECQDSVWLLIFQRVQDYTNYFLNLTDANMGGPPVWQKEYSAKVCGKLLDYLKCVFLT